MGYRRLLTILVLAAIVPLAIGAAALAGKNVRLGRLGNHRTIDDALIFEFHGQLYALRYEKYAVPQKLGSLTFLGDVTAVPLQGGEQHRPLPAANAGAGPERQAPARPGERAQGQRERKDR